MKQNGKIRFIGFLLELEYLLEKLKKCYED